MSTKDGVPWQSVYYVTLYRFNRQAYTEAIKLFRASGASGSYHCTYNEDKYWFHLSCPATEGDGCLEALSETVDNYIATLLKRTSKPKNGPKVKRIPESLVLMPLLGVYEEDDWDLNKDREDADPDDESHGTMMPQKLVDEEWEPREAVEWVPKSDVDLTKLATDEVLEELEMLSGCELELDAAAETVLIYSKNNQDVDRLLDKLDVLQRQYLRKPIISHAVRVDGRSKFRFVKLTKVGDGALGRTLLPLHVAGNIDLSNVHVLCSLSWDVATTTFVVQKREVRGITPALLENAPAISGNDCLRDIGEEIQVSVTPTISPVKDLVERPTASSHVGALSFDVEQWMDTFVEQVEKTADTSMVSSVNQSALKEVDTIPKPGSQTQFPMSEGSSHLLEQSEQNKAPKGRGSGAESSDIVGDSSVKTSISGHNENWKPFSVSKPWGVEDTGEDKSIPATTSTQEYPGWQQVQNRTVHGEGLNPRVSGRNTRSRGGRGGGQIQETRGQRGNSSETRGSPNYVTSRNPFVRAPMQNENSSKSPSHIPAPSHVRGGHSFRPTTSRGGGTRSGGPRNSTANRNSFLIDLIMDEEEEENGALNRNPPPPGYGWQFSSRAPEVDHSAEASATGREAERTGSHTPTQTLPGSAQMLTNPAHVDSKIEYSVARAEKISPLDADIPTQATASRIEMDGLLDVDRRTQTLTLHAEADSLLDVDLHIQAPAPRAAANNLLDVNHWNQAPASRVAADIHTDLLELTQASPSVAQPWQPMTPPSDSTLTAAQVLDRPIPEEENEALKRRFYNMMGQQKPSPKTKSKPTKVTALNNLREDFLKADTRLKPKEPTLLKPPKKPEPTPAPNVPHELTEIVKQALAISKSFNGKFDLEMQIGQILGSDLPQFCLDGDFDDANDVTSTLLAADVPSYHEMYGAFSGNITSSTGDIAALLELLGLGLEPDPISDETHWEFICIEPNKKEVHIFLDATNADAAPFATANQQVLGACYFHYPDNVHDARFLLSGTKHYDISRIDGAKALLESVTFREPEPGKIDKAILEARMGATLHVDAVRLRRCVRYNAPAPFADTHSILITRIHDPTVYRQPIEHDPEHRLAVCARFAKEPAMIAEQAFIYEFSCAQTSPAQDDAFAENMTLKLGEQAKWSVDDVVDGTGLKQLEELGTHMVRAMDGIGARNVGPAWMLEKELRKESAKKREEKENALDNIQWEALATGNRTDMVEVKIEE